MSYIYIYQLKDWPHFQWDKEAITEILADVRFRQGRLLGSYPKTVPEANRYIYRNPK